MTLRFLLPLSFLGLSLLQHCVLEAQPAPSACGNPPAMLHATQPNIFTEQQEQWLGEAMADHMDVSSRPVRNADANAYLETIGDRLLKALPASTLKFHFTLVESAEVNGFSLAGGRIYLTRKLVASARTEDEIAAVMAHEMGHILTHQFAIETTADLRRLLGVTSVSDRGDIYAKYQRLVDARMHDKHATDPDSDEAQDQADRVAVYATANAGYRPQAYEEFWDRSFFVEGKTGSKMGDLFGITKPEQKRLRKLRGIIAELPAGCGATVAAAATPQFQQWQKLVQDDQASTATGTKANTKSGAKMETAGVVLTPPLHMEMDRLRFSRDGRYILAQDESSIFVLTREPFREIFRIDAENARPADFSPDSSEVSFTTPNLHVERWNIAGKSLIKAYDLVVKDECFEGTLSPDARTIVCTVLHSDGWMTVSLLDVATGNVLFEKKDWVQANYSLLGAIEYHRLNHDRSDLISSSVSADGNVMLFGPGSKRLAFDLRSRTPIAIGGALTNDSYQTIYCFLGDDKVAAVDGDWTSNSGVFSFPRGARIEQLKLGLSKLRAATKSELVLTSGPKDAVSAVADIHAGKYLATSRSAGLDLYEDMLVSENLDGSLALMSLKAGSTVQPQRAMLSMSPLAGASSVAMSADGRYLAYSSRTHGAAFDLQTGREMALTRGFRGAAWTPEDTLLGDFVARGSDARTIREISLTPPHATDIPVKLEDGMLFETAKLLQWKPDKKTWTFTASSPKDGAVVWTRSFKEDHPGYTTNYGNSDLLLSYPLSYTSAKEKLRAEPELKTQVDAVRDKNAGRLIEVVDSRNGKTLAQAVVEVPLSYESVDGFASVGDLLYLTTGDNRTLVYSLHTGAQLRQFFGRVIAADQASGVVCAVNRTTEAIALDAKGNELQHMTLDSPVRFVSVLNGGHEVVVLTADQRVRRLALTAQ